jgi:GNAT superfamily N-acetyltransferase
MRVRKARETDLDGITRLYACLHPHHLAEPNSEAEVSWRKIVNSRTSTIFVAELDGLLVSTCMVAVLPSFAKAGRPIGVIEHVVTLEEFRGRGFARDTMSAAISYAWQRSCGKLLLLSGANRLEAHKMYESLGFDGNVERGFVMRAPGALLPTHVQ